MKREFLEGLGLTKEQTDAIMSEHGRGLEALKSRNAELETISTGYEELKKEKDALLSELEGERASHSSFKKSVICELVDNAHPSSTLARDELIRRLENCSVTEIYDTLSKLRISDPSAFSDYDEHPIFSSVSRGDEAPAPITFVRRR